MSDPLAAFTKAVELNPSSARAHYNLVTLLLKMDIYHAAVSSIREAIRINPSIRRCFLRPGCRVCSFGR